jgi:hypothetical protein
MTTPTFNLEFDQGVPREFAVSDWADKSGRYYDTSDTTGHLVVRDKIGGALLFELTSAAGEIQTYARQIVSLFSAENIAKLAPLAGARPITGSPSSAPQYKAGVYELRITNEAGIPVPVVRGDVLITLGVAV